MEFGLGNNKQIRDAYPQNAIITLPTYEGKGVAKASLNGKALEVLGLVSGEENEIAFSTSNSDVNKTFVINANNYDSKANIKVKKDGVYSNKNNFTVLKQRFNTDVADELLLEIVPTEREFDGQAIFELKRFKTTETAELVGDSDELEHTDSNL